MATSRKSAAKSKKPSAVHSLYGGKIVPENVALRGMVSLEKEIKAQGAKDWARQQEINKHLNKIYAPLRKISDDESAAEGVQEFRAYRDRLLKHKPTPPAVRKETERITLGSITALVVPPYDYGWMYWTAPQSGGLVSVNADELTGQMNFAIDSFESDSFNVSAAVGVGIFFRPPTSKGSLTVWTDPSYGDMWDDYASFSASHSSGYLELYVLSYDNNGKSKQVLKRTHSLWDDDSHFGGQGPHEGWGTYALSGSCNVDSSHYYVIWVIVGGRAAAGGVAWASSALGASVPAIVWQLNS